MVLAVALMCFWCAASFLLVTIRRLSIIEFSWPIWAPWLLEVVFHPSMCVASCFYYDIPGVCFMSYGVVHGNLGSYARVTTEQGEGTHGLRIEGTMDQCAASAGSVLLET